MYDVVVIELLRCSSYFTSEFRRIARPSVDACSFDAGVCGDSDVHAVCYETETLFFHVRSLKCILHFGSGSLDSVRWERGNGCNGTLECRSQVSVLWEIPMSLSHLKKKQSLLEKLAG